MQYSPEILLHTSYFLFYDTSYVDKNKLRLRGNVRFHRNMPDANPMRSDQDTQRLPVVLRLMFLAYFAK